MAGIIAALEDLDPSLEITKVLSNEQEKKSLPSEDSLLLDKIEQKKEVLEEQEGNKEESSSDPETTEDQPEDAEEGSEEEMQVIDGKHTTVATESLRNDDHYNRIALESFGEDESVFKKAGSFIADAAWTGVKFASSYAYHAASELGTFLKEAGIKYGPAVFKFLKVSVIYILVRLFRSFNKVKSLVVKAYFQKKHSFSRHKKRVLRLKQVVELLGDDYVLSNPNPFVNDEYFKFFYVGDKADPKASIAAMNNLLDVVVNELDKGIEHEISVVQRLVEVTKRGVRFDTIPFLSVKPISANFLKRTVEGYDRNPELMNTYVLNQSIPAYTLLMMSLPKQEVVNEAARSEDMSQVVKAYQESFVILGVNPNTPKTIAQINYMDKKSLLLLLQGVEEVCDKALSHVEFYKKLENASNKLKASYQSYFSWLVEDDRTKSLKESFAELIYLKQSFIAKVYLPGAVDIHDFTSLYLTTILRYIEENIKVINPAVQDSAV